MEDVKKDDNIIGTLVNSLIDSGFMVGKLSWKFTKWCFDGWVNLEKPKFNILFEETKLYNSNKKNKPILKKENHTNKTDVYIFTIPTGLSILDFTKRKEQIAQFLHTDLQHIKIENKNNLACITVYKDDAIEYFYEDYQFSMTKDIQIPLGINLENWNVVYWNPNETNSCHLLIAGNTGAGKSTLVYIILAYIIQYRDDVDLYLQDVKKVDMPYFANAKQVVRYNPGKDYADETIAALVDEMNARYDYLTEKKVRSMSELKPKDRLNSIIYVVEELAVFKYGNGKGKDAKFFEKLRLILEQGRAVNITVICITQSPYSGTLPGEWKANFPCIVGLKTRTQEASKVITGDYELLTNLRGRGHGYLLSPQKDIEFQAFNIKLDTIKKIVEKNKKTDSEKDAGDSISADFRILD